MTALRRLSPLLFIFLLTDASVLAAPSTMAGSTQMSSSTASGGVDSYTVDYSFPSTVQTGSNLTVTVTLLVSKLSGFGEYISNYAIQVMVYVDFAHVLRGTLGSNMSLQGSPYLYPGARWGPYNVTIPVTESNTGLAPGHSAEANLTIALQNEVFDGGDINTYFPEGSQGAAGQLTIQAGGGDQNRPASQNYLSYLLLGAGGVLVLLLVATRSKSPSTKAPAGTMSYHSTSEPGPGSFRLRNR